ncbi:hypothetical protein B0H15DRAFT_855335 [Mycena belliarum]|uniref:F-box domain-containing protein n=1 Tax=Mycena belliarum TaxID=1033014 RepID=A0AAD6XN03_9AGAR|nr:hypothetical protein B0H15DRAFT_855335 [Mycena belliae]
MAVRLPDEIISEILTPALTVPDHLFSAPTVESPFATYTESASATLLVNKDWLRVATPLLYHVVVLRSAAQAQALAAALKKNPELGGFIKQLRVEGGFGRAMEAVLSACPNITDIALSLHLHASDSSAGLAIGLPLINPTRLVICDDEENIHKNRHVGILIVAVQRCARNWTKLTTVVLPYPLVRRSRQVFVTDICALPSLTHVSFPIPRFYNGHLSPHIEAIAEIPSIQVIEIRAEMTEEDAKRREAMAQIVRSRRLTQVLKWKDIREPTTASPDILALPPANPLFRPMVASSSATTDLVWDRVLFFATAGTAYRDPPKKTVLDRVINTRRLRYLLVCKTFHRLALPYLYWSPSLKGKKQVVALVHRLAAVPALGLHLRTLEIIDRFHSLCLPDLTPPISFAAPIFYGGPSAHLFSR